MPSRFSLTSSRLLAAFYLAVASAMAAPEAAPAASAGTTSAQGEEAAKPASADMKAPAATEDAEYEVDMDATFETARSLYDNYAVDELKRKFDFPSREQWDGFVQRLQKALQSDNVDDLIALKSEATNALTVIEAVPAAQDLSTWLKERLSYIEAAETLKKSGVLTPSTGTLRPPLRPGTSPLLHPEIPAYDYWYARIQTQKAPAQSGELMPVLAAVFTEEAVPKELAWLVEVESMFNLEARSPAGALGLFQLMPDTAKSLGLNIWSPDERLHPQKSARAAAMLLRRLHRRFQDWPLAIAAYNAGEGTVRRLLEKKRGAKTFADIASALPLETRLYVPKVLATVEVRTGVGPLGLAAPGS